MRLDPRLQILSILGVAAVLEYGHGHREGHWIVPVGLWADDGRAAFRVARRRRSVMYAGRLAAAFLSATVLAF
ncbi:hypothetical protein [Microvirga arabica]|uniref:hypothetical protein n=1 Tax=Microvirga arabica TaxID=1128671 RepID=UPI00193991B2|nr:hypothetical protein [Microvirga arabica]MBM1171560.1 hypothetical protein [Microvirga arabica]